jgi:uncharacterized coiled-coil protein SlyX
VANVQRQNQIAFGVSVEPTVDKKKAQSVIRDILDLQKKLGPVTISLNQVAKQASTNIQEIKELSAAAGNFAKKLSQATQSSFQDLGKLGDQLEAAAHQASVLQDALKTADKDTKAAIEEELGHLSKTITDLNKQYEAHQKVNHKYGQELKNVVKAQDKYQKSLQEAADYSPKDAIKGIIQSVSKGISTGNLKGGLVEAGGHAVKGVKGGLARGSLQAEAGGAEALAGALGKAAAGIGLVVASISVLLKFIAAASDHQVKLNKTLMDGIGTAGDFTAAAGNYRKSIDEIRGAAMSSAGALLRFGANSETALQAINAYAKESTGSLMKTRDVMTSFGKGDLTAGVTEFSRNAIVYGKALGMEVTEVASMMGKFVGEVGYGADQVQDLMGDIVKAAATSGMPVHKFMNIFKETTTDVELFTNRIEELTGVMKMLSKSMSPSDVKKFMDAFKKGFQGKSFKERLGHVLVAGVPQVSGILKKDFDQKAQVMGAKFEEFGAGFAKQFKDAFESGNEDAMNDLLVKAKAKGATGAQIGEAQKLMSAEKERRAGGALSTASATKGASLWSTVKIMGAEMKRFGMGGRITGINEQVAEKRGYSQDQIDSMNQLINVMNLYGKSLKKYGTTGSKSMDKSLKKILAATKKAGEPVTPEDMANATEDQIAAAAEDSNKDKKTKNVAVNLAQEQVSLTTSLSEKIDNVLAFILEQIYKVLNDYILDILNDIMDGIMEAAQYTGAVAKLIGNLIDLMLPGQSDMIKALLDIHKEERARKKMASGEGPMRREGKKELEVTKEYKESEDTQEAGDNVTDLKEIKQASAKELAIQQLEKKQAETKDEKKAAAYGKIIDSLKPKKAEKKDETPVPMDAGDKPPLSEVEQGKLAGTPGADVAAGAAGMGAGAAAGMAGAAGAAAAAHPAVKATEDGLKDVREGAEDHAKEQIDQGEDIYSGIHDVAGMLKKGIKYEESWMRTRWKKTLKEGTLDAFRTALVEYAVIEAKLKDEGYAKKFAEHGKDILKSGKTLEDIGQMDEKQFDEYIEKASKGSKAIGGPIPDTGMYNLHKGEYVVPAAAASKGMGGPTTVNLVVNGSTLSPQQLEGVVYGALDKAKRMH